MRTCCVFLRGVLHENHKLGRLLSANRLGLAKNEREHGEQTALNHWDTEESWMPNLLIRDVPEQIRTRIRRESKLRLTSQNACLVSLISEAGDRRAKGTHIGGLIGA